MSLFGWARKPSSSRKAARRIVLQLEALEDRTVLTAAGSPVQTVYNVAAGDVAGLIADINAANSNGASNPTTINLTASTYDFTSANNNTYGPNALPAITGNVTIVGNGAVLERDPSLGQNTPFRFFYVSGSQVASPTGNQSTGVATGSLTLENLTLEGGLAQGGSSGTGGGGLGAGGAIFNQGNLTLNGVTVAQNEAEGGSSGSGTSTSGGGLGSTSTTSSTTTTTTSSTFGVGGNGAASGSGGAGGVGGGGGAGATAGAGGFGAGAGNASAGGGGLGAGGAIFNVDGTVTITNSTLADNLAQGGQGASGSSGGDGYGGGVFNLDGTLNVTTSTLADNGASGAANAGGAIYNLAMGTTTGTSGTAQGVPSTVTLTDSILSNSFASNDLVNDQNNSTAGSAVVNATAPNIVMSMSTIDAATTNGTPNTANPQLSLLFNYGGPTPTMPPQAGSPALGAGTSGSTVPNVDQRGVTRGNVIDLGAVQITPPSAASSTLTLSASPSSASSGQTVTLTATITSSSSSTTPAGTVEFVDGTTGTTLGSAPVTVVNSQAQATLSVTTLTAGSHNVTATYTSSNGLGGSSGSTTVTVGSSSTSSTTTATSTANAQWLNAVYQVLFKRSIDPSGLSYWSSVLASGASHAQVVYDLEKTTEYQTDQVQALYQQLLGTPAPQSAVSYLVSLMQGGTNFRTIEALVAGSGAFYQASGGTNIGFLNAVYQDFLGRPLDTTGQQQWGALLTAGYSPTQVVLGILSTTEYQTDLVEYDYLTYMGRPADPTSLAAFVSALADGSTNNDMIVASLLGSGEFVTQVTGQ